ncbi:hypothetical protein ACG33_08910 [Steroidobacter denitrificans]|uniref:Acyltransferase superfamily protein n=1 Tax=Steroidobacter denitrificans TaxID=465721 RepID=A0A127FC54_STEDE|nr:GNAT family N-acetyltransferase [Steroidobacter denitrificans]AMN47211.1 hypothetical protein ACG33_08910 [Steroidobacter denitrificans]
MQAATAVRVLSSIQDIPASQWNALVPDGHPFMRHEFLQALELEGCVGQGTTWKPEHLLLHDARGRPEAALPLYRKHDSWGEFVFDWSWAKAYAQAGLRYYPKLVSMAPFTPASGPRLLLARGSTSAASLCARLCEALIVHARREQLSSAHLLFLDETDRAALQEYSAQGSAERTSPGDPGAAHGALLWRKDCQFHWFNRDYADFDAYLTSFRAEKRKKALRERRRIREAGITFQTLAGEQMDDVSWDIVFAFSAATFASRGHEHYLNAAFFRRVARALPGAVMVKLACHRGTPIAAAIFFRSADTLYGRYWGAAQDFHSLHFETCYYQGIEYCIQHGLARFEPGTQGEHKVPRGFEPTATWSAHWIAERRFYHAIDNYLDAERTAVDQYIRQVEEHLPFRRDTEMRPADPMIGPGADDRVGHEAGRGTDRTGDRNDRER